MLLQLEQQPPHIIPAAQAGRPTLSTGCCRQTRRRHSSSTATCTGWSISWKDSLGTSPSPASSS